MQVQYMHCVYVSGALYMRCAQLVEHSRQSVEHRWFESHQGQFIFISLRKVTALGVLCFIVVCTTLLASFFLPSSSLINIHVHVHVYIMCIHVHCI